MKTCCVIPARFASTRLPGKPLALIDGVPMIVRVVRQVSLADLDHVVVAVDDERVRDVVADAGFEALMTRPDHPSGSDRVMEVVTSMGWGDDDIVINVQGDEPLIPPMVISQLADTLAAEPALHMATLSEPLSTPDDFSNPNVVKVVCDARGDALYFSRAPIPYPRDHMQTLHETVRTEALEQTGASRHIGIYGFRVAGLRTFVGLTHSRLEQIERLEQLRWLEAGHRLRVIEASMAVPGGVDTPEDLARVASVLAGA